MTEELQSLIDHIQKDGVAKAESRAQEIVAAAEQKAAEIQRKAEESAQAIRQKAEQDAEAFRERGEQSLRHAARDLLLSIGKTLETMLTEVVAVEIDQTLTGAALESTLTQAVEGYFSANTGSANLEVIVNPEQKKAVEDWFTGKFAAKLKGGARIVADDALASGFRLSAGDTRIQHDFSGEAIAEALAKLLRPRLAAIVRASAETLQK